MTIQSATRISNDPRIATYISEALSALLGLDKKAKNYISLV